MSTSAWCEIKHSDTPFSGARIDWGWVAVLYFSHDKPIQLARNGRGLVR